MYYAYNTCTCTCTCTVHVDVYECVCKFTSFWVKSSLIDFIVLVFALFTVVGLDDILLENKQLHNEKYGLTTLISYTLYMY